MALSDIFKSLDRWVGYRPESRMLTPAQFWGSGMDTRFASPGRTAAGEAVDIETALALPVVLRAISLVSNGIGPLPIDAFRRVGDRRQETPLPVWLRVPDPGNLNFRRPQFISQCVASLMADGNMFVRAYPDRFRTQWVKVLDPWRVRIETGTDGIDRYRVGSALLGSEQVVHVPMLTLPGQSRGKSHITLMAEPIASGLAATKFGGYFFANGAAMQGVIEAPAGAQVDAKQIKEQMERGNRGLSKSHALGVLTGGATFKELTAKPRDSQLIELLEFIVEEVGRAYGIPPFKLGSTKPGAVAYASTSNAREEYGETVQGYVSLLEDAFSSLVIGEETFIKFNLRAVLRSNAEARFLGYHTLLQDSVITKDEVRAWEDWGPADEAAGVETEHGGYLETPNNTAPGDSPTDETPDDHPAPPQRSIEHPAEDDVRAITVNVHQPDMADVSDRMAAFVEAAEARAIAAEQRAVLAEERISELVARVPVVNVEAPVVNVAPADVTVNVPEQAAPQVRVNVPAVQHVVIDALPPMNARVKRDRAGRIESLEG